jgi:tetratricopeptide (TPR) repeat protein
VIGLFEQAAAGSPNFARVYAAMSSAYFQNAFLNYNTDRETDCLLARKNAEKGMEIDPLDPFVNFSMGQVFWVEDNIAGGLGWLDRAIDLNPNYAQGHYAWGWAEFVGQRDQPDDSIDMALALSPLDPFKYAMLGVRSFSCLSKGDLAGAAYWGGNAAKSPGAHVFIAMIAVVMYTLNDQLDVANWWTANVRKRNPMPNWRRFCHSVSFCVTTIAETNC